VKHWYASKTIWFNALALIVMIATQAFGFGEFVMSPEVAEFGTAAVILINLALRLVTKQALGR